MIAVVVQLRHNRCTAAQNTVMAIAFITTAVVRRTTVVAPNRFVIRDNGYRCRPPVYPFIPFRTGPADPPEPTLRRTHASSTDNPGTRPATRNCSAAQMANITGRSAQSAIALNRFLSRYARPDIPPKVPIVAEASGSIAIRQPVRAKTARRDNVYHEQTL